MASIRGQKRAIASAPSAHHATRLHRSPRRGGQLAAQRTAHIRRVARIESKTRAFRDSRETTHFRLADAQLAHRLSTGSSRFAASATMRRVDRAAWQLAPEVKTLSSYSRRAVQYLKPFRQTDYRAA